MGGRTFRGRGPGRVFATIAVIGSVGWLVACGKGDEPTVIGAVQKCLEDEGLEVRAAKAGPDDHDAPERAELLTAGALVAFYSSSDRAEKRAPAVRKDAQQARGEVARYDDVTVIYLANASRDKIENCVQR